VAVYAEAVSDNVQDELRRHMFRAIWAQRRHLSSAYDIKGRRIRHHDNAPGLAVGGEQPSAGAARCHGG